MNLTSCLLLTCCGGSYLVLLIYIYVVLCLANYGASEAVYPCIAASLSQGPGEQRLLQLLVSQQAAQGAPHPAIGGGHGGQSGVGRQGRPLRRPQQQAGPRCGGGGGHRFSFGSRGRGDHSGWGPPRGRRRAARWRPRTAGRRLEGQEEAGTRWRCRQQRTAGVPHADPCGTGQGRERAVLQAFLFWGKC